MTGDQTRARQRKHIAASSACEKVTKVGQEAPPLGPKGHEKWSLILDQALSLIPAPRPQGKANQVEGYG